jgi:hypothetical protein
VKVTVIRESRAVDIARNHAPGTNGDTRPPDLREGLPVEDSPIQAA